MNDDAQKQIKAQTMVYYLLKYDISELRETGRGAEMRLRKLRNGIGVFHYIG